MATTITAVRPIMVGGVFRAAGQTASVADDLAAQLVFNGDATYVTAPTNAPSPGNFETVAAGIHTWAGGAATTDSISVPGIRATDVIKVTLIARSATENLALAALDVPNGQIDLTLSANGANGTTKLAYSVERAY